MPVLRHVALLVETSRGYGRGLVRGVTRYHRENRRWSVYFQPHGLDDPPPEWFTRWRGDGVLARVGNRQMAEAVRAVGPPVVELRGVLTDIGYPFIGVDNLAVARLGLEHLLDRGFRHLAFCGLPRAVHPLMDDRCDYFKRLAAESGFTCNVFSARGGQQGGWERQQENIARWIKSLPKPVGMMTCNDDIGMQVLDACRRAEVAVPDEVAVIGVDNDEYLCGLSIPPLTSIDVMPDRIGYEAAAMLDRMMEGHSIPAEPILMAPRGIVVRQSTDVLATEDRDVARALAFIRAHACERIQVSDVLTHVGLSRSILEPRLKQVLARTIHQEIQRVRIERGKEFLGTTDLPIKQIAARCGFRCVQHFTQAFRQGAGQPPAAYRKQTLMK